MIDRDATHITLYDTYDDDDENPYHRAVIPMFYLFPKGTFTYYKGYINHMFTPKAVTFCKRSMALYEMFVDQTEFHQMTANGTILRMVYQDR